ncbi:KR domain-containing protein [Micromonospora sp. NPDC018662]|uniref:KR domain-containing protein n=1 Tax=Micromonospora sp. NPDC018662 TaxID=3364238 RepID=UPI00378A8988
MSPQPRPRSGRIALRALRPEPTPVRTVPRAARWRVNGPTGHPLVDHLRRQPYPAAGPEVDVLVLADRWPAAGSAGLLDAYRRSTGRMLTVVHSGAGGGSLLRGLAASDGRPAGTIALAEPTVPALRRAVGLLAAPAGGDEFTVDADGAVHTIGWTATPLPGRRPRLAGRTVLVTGGLGGLGSRIAVALAAAGATPVLLDRRTVSECPPDVRRIVGVLRRRCPAARLRTADLTDPEATGAALAGLRPYAIVHCAGRIAGGTGVQLDGPAVDALVAAKVTSLETVLATVRTGRLRAVLAFGSLTAHGAHPDLAGYALANELLRRATARYAAAHPTVRCCTAEWSLWSGAGMARQVARLAARRLGMVPVPVATGVTAAVRLLAALADPPADTDPPGSLLICGERPGTQGAWAGRPEGVPGVDAALMVPAGDDLDAAIRSVAEAAAGDATLIPEGTVGGAPLLVRATVSGDGVDCLVHAGSDPEGPALRNTRFRLFRAGG